MRTSREHSHIESLDGALPAQAARRQAVDGHERHDLSASPKLDALLESEHRLQMAVAVARLGVIEVDYRADTAKADAGAAKLFDLPSGCPVSREAYRQRVHEADRTAWDAAIHSSLDPASHGTCELEVRVCDELGKVRWLNMRNSTVFDDYSSHRQPIRAIMVVMDITAHKQAEEYLRRSKATFEALVSRSPFGVYVVDADFRLQHLSQGARKVFKNIEPLIGRDFGEIIRIVWQAPFAEEIIQQFKHTLETGESYVANSVEQRANIDAAEAYYWRLERIELPDGRPGVVCYFYDNTERVEHEQAMKASAQRVQLALRAGGLAAWEWTPTGSYWSKDLHELLGIPEDTAAEVERFYELVHPEDLPGLKRAWQAAIEGTESFDHQFRIIRPDGKMIWMGGVGEVIRDSHDRVTRIYGLNWDATEEKLQAQALQDSQQRAMQESASKSEFLANMSHEIRTPMTAILGYTELLGDYVDNDEARGYLKTIQQNGAFLLDIINDILDLSKIEAGKLEIMPERFNPERIFEDVHSIMDVRAALNNLKLIVEYATPIPTVIESDGKRLKQILINLVGNAIKFTKRGEVRIIVSAGGDMSLLQVEVIDSGIGMSQAQQESLFKPFSQGHPLVTREFGGTGLGLAISQRLAAMLGGEIRCQSELGTGSHFTLTIATGKLEGIPLSEPHRGATSGDEPLSSSAPVASAVNSSPSCQLNCAILVVDDRRDIRFLSQRILSKAGARVSEAEDGLVALEKVRLAVAAGEAPDLILLDMHMPNLDGYETARQLREFGYSGAIIALTADAMQGDMSRCLKAGCNDYLSKPIDSQRLLALVAEFCRRAAKKRD